MPACRRWTLPQRLAERDIDPPTGATSRYACVAQAHTMEHGAFHYRRQLIGSCSIQAAIGKAQQAIVTSLTGRCRLTEAGRMVGLTATFACSATCTFPDRQLLKYLDLLKGAFAAGLHLGVGVASMDDDRATDQIESWMREVNKFMEEFKPRKGKS